MTRDDLNKYCDQVLARHARSFRVAALFLPKSMRKDASLAYAFCRLVDDTVDECTSKTTARQELEGLEEAALRVRRPPPLLHLGLCGVIGRAA